MTESSLFRQVVTPEEAGGRLDKWLGGRPEITSREMARRLILQGEVTLNAQPGGPAAKVRGGDVVEYRIPPPIPLELEPEHGPLVILHEDEWLLVVDKPPGLTVHPTPGHRTGTLVNLLLGHCKDLSGIGGVVRPGIVHRLDKNTSGVLVVAKNDEAHLHLAAQFKAHTVRRTYMALVAGTPPKRKGKIDLPLGRHKKHRYKRSVQEEGKQAITNWRLEKSWGSFSLLRLRLETGRTHQIRVHLAASGWPVVGDPQYGGGRYKGMVLEASLLEKLNDFRRQALHAAELGFTHPSSGEFIRCSTPPPPDMQELLETLERLRPAEPLP